MMERRSWVGGREGGMKEANPHKEVTWIHKLWPVHTVVYDPALKRKEILGTSLVVQWLRICASTVGGAGSIPGPENKILHAA